jgi:hypothetical protein
MRIQTTWSPTTGGPPSLGFEHQIICQICQTRSWQDTDALEDLKRVRAWLHVHVYISHGDRTRQYADNLAPGFAFLRL